MAHTAMEHGFSEHPKIIGLHDRAFRFHMTALDWTGRNGTDGHVTGRGAKVVAAILNTQTKRWTDELVQARLWTRDPEGDGFWINDYLTHNPSAAALRSLSDKRRKAGIKGAEKRWGTTPETVADASGISYGKELMPGLVVKKDLTKGFSVLDTPADVGPTEQPPDTDEATDPVAVRQLIVASLKEAS